MPNIALYPFEIKTNKSNTKQMENWLSKLIGILECEWTVVYYYAETSYYFKYEKDAMLFALRWL